MKQMTNEQYVENKGLHCPYCNSIEVYSTGKTIINIDGVYHPMRCNDCDHDWDDEYKLIGYLGKNNGTT